LVVSRERGVLGKELWRALKEVGELGCRLGAAEGWWEASLVPSHRRETPLTLCMCFRTAEVAVGDKQQWKIHLSVLTKVCLHRSRGGETEAQNVYF